MEKLPIRVLEDLAEDFELFKRKNIYQVDKLLGLRARGRVNCIWSNIQPNLKSAIESINKDFEPFFLSQEIYHNLKGAVKEQSWDWHGDRGETLERMAREDIPDFDHAFSTFVQDLDERGMLEDTTVVVWGEMGRTPTINHQGGRDHWPNMLSALLIGGGMQRGVVVGSTDGHAAEPKERPVHVQEVFATLYHNLGIGTETTTIADLSGRPHYLVDNGAQPIPELVG